LLGRILPKKLVSFVIKKMYGWYHAFSFYVIILGDEVMKTWKYS
jgi:hypothetical protein